MQHVLVTGGYGYVGAPLVAALAADPSVAVTAASRTPHPEQPAVRAAVVDWSDGASIARLCAGQDTIVHLAAMNEQDAARSAEAALEVNGAACLRLLEAATGAGVRRFVYASTSKVFGNNPSGVIDEASLPRPTSDYAITHRLAEDYVLSRHGKRKIEGVVLRLANAVGAPLRPGPEAWLMIANDFCRQAVTLGRVVLKGSGLAWRNFVPLADVVAALRHATAVPAGALGDGLFHVGAPQPMQIWDLAVRVAERGEALSGRKIALERKAPEPGEALASLDWKIDKLIASGWRPAGDIDSEIDATLALCAELYGWFESPAADERT